MGWLCRARLPESVIPFTSQLITARAAGLRTLSRMLLEAVSYCRRGGSKFALRSARDYVLCSRRRRGANVDIPKCEICFRTDAADGSR